MRRAVVRGGLVLALTVVTPGCFHCGVGAPELPPGVPSPPALLSACENRVTSCPTLPDLAAAAVVATNLWPSAGAAVAHDGYVFALVSNFVDAEESRHAPFILRWSPDTEALEVPLGIEERGASSYHLACSGELLGAFWAVGEIPPYSTYVPFWPDSMVAGTPILFDGELAVQEALVADGRLIAIVGLAGIKYATELSALGEVLEGPSLLYENTLGDGNGSGVSVAARASGGWVMGYGMVNRRLVGACAGLACDWTELPDGPDTLTAVRVVDTPSGAFAFHQLAYGAPWRVVEIATSLEMGIDAPSFQRYQVAWAGDRFVLFGEIDPMAGRLGIWSMTIDGAVIEEQTFEEPENVRPVAVLIAGDDLVVLWRRFSPEGVLPFDLMASYAPCVQ